MDGEEIQQAGTETATSNGTASTASEEAKFDPTTLDPKLVPVYKGMEAAHTKRSQELAEQRRAYEAERAEFEAQRQAHLAEIAAMQTRAQETQAQEGLEGASSEMVQLVKQQVAAQTRPFVQKQVEAEITELSNDPKHGALFKALMPQIAQVIRKTGLSMKEAFAVAAGPEKFFETGRQAAFAETQKKIASPQAEKPSTATGASAHAGKMTKREAFEATLREVGITP